ncbi:uncharacterized protein PV09_06808 [Verruconis gallopava]|uniref:Uncharacterized protein n=1 Tax=Verruconis gallopava TaxID=253628 RepID=A0A0D1YMH1_9PEZI|nr:uncharacterized protein PV09_06808 [Verruconis gallopava]KIW01972.1 hypothetical protein PV09_06808 [Verruconis gallopava]
MTDARLCLQYLADNAPLWIKSLDELQARIQRRQIELARVAVPAVQKVKKTSSNESLRHSRPETSTPSTGLELTSAPQPHDGQQSNTANGQMITPCRKRKTASLLSAASGTHKYRSRAAVTVYYDSEVQDVFDRIVRNISTGRNNIRKSRLAERVANMANMHNTANQPPFSGENALPLLRTVRSASGMPRFNAYIEESLRLSGRLASLRPPPMAQLGAEVKSDTAVKRTDAREEADAALDKAQEFCEKGAHQFLRDGDCGEELAGARAAFEEVIAISNRELEELARKAAADAKRVEGEKEDEKEDEKKEEEEDGEMMQLERDGQEQDGKHKERAHLQSSSINQHPALIQAAGIIEADDDESDGDYDDPSLLPSPHFRLMART